MVKTESEQKQLQYNYELNKQKEKQGEVKKLSFFHLPWRLFLAAAFIFDIITDIVVLKEMYDNDVKQNFYFSLVILIITTVLMIAFSCSYRITDYPTNGCLRLLFNLLGFLGLDSIIYFIYSGLTLQGYTLHDYKILGPQSPRKQWGAFQSVLSSFSTCHYIFYYPQASTLAVISLWVSILNVRLNINMDHSVKDFKAFLKYGLFTMRFMSTLFEIIGRPLFYGCTTLIVLNESTFLSDDRRPFKLTYEFFAWDALLLGIAAFVMFFLYKFILIKNLQLTCSLVVQNFVNSALLRPSVSRRELKEVKLAQKLVVFLDQKKMDTNLLKKQIKYGLGAPCVWRLGEYIALNIVLYHYDMLDVASTISPRIEVLTYIAGISNLINLIFLLISLYIIFTVPIQFDEKLTMGQTQFYNGKDGSITPQNKEEHNILNVNINEQLSSSKNGYKQVNQQSSANQLQNEEFRQLRNPSLNSQL